jgi:hypothetical protein
MFQNSVPFQQLGNYLCENRTKYNFLYKTLNHYLLIYMHAMSMYEQRKQSINLKRFQYIKCRYIVLYIANLFRYPGAIFPYSY